MWFREWIKKYSIRNNTTIIEGIIKPHKSGWSTTLTGIDCWQHSLDTWLLISWLSVAAITSTDLAISSTSKALVIIYHSNNAIYSATFWKIAVGMVTIRGR